MKNEMVYIYVGSEKEEFEFYAPHLLEASPFFYAALKGGFRESVEQRVYLPSVDTEVFKSFKYWVEHPRHHLHYFEPAGAWQLGLSLNIFADTYHIHALKDLTSDRIMDRACGVKRSIKPVPLKYEYLLLIYD